MTESPQQSGILSWERRGALGVLFIDNPPGNYLPRPDFADAAELRRWFSADNLLGVALTGRGRHFSGGADLAALPHQDDDEMALLQTIRLGHAILDAIAACPVPVVAAISGACLGGGLEIALACHLRVCTPRAVFGFPEAGLGLIPGLGGTVRLPHVVGLDRALMLLLAADTVDAGTALRLGLVHHVAAEGTALDAALALLARLTRDRSRAVVTAVVRAIANAAVMDPGEAMAEEARAFCRLAVNREIKA